MKNFVVAFFALFFVSCSVKHHDQIETEIKTVESQKGHNVVSYEIKSEKDSTDKYIVDYTAIVDGNQKSSGHLVFSVTADGLLSR